MVLQNKKEKTGMSRAARGKRRGGRRRRADNGGRSSAVTSALRRCGAAVLWLLVIGAAGLPAVFMNSLYGYIPVLFLLSAMAISAGGTFYMRKKMETVAAADDVSCERGSSVDIALRLVNKSALFCPKASADLYISDLFGGNDSVRRINFTISGHEEVDFGFGMDMPHIGLYSVGLDHVDIYGFFGVMRLRVPVSCRFTAAVTPRIRPLDEFHVVDEVLSEASTDTRITVAGGTDYTGVREYALGDPMKQIHWKLSAHSREYVTKLQESSRQQEFSVILDFAAESGSDRETMMDINDCLIETALSIIDDISRHDAAYTLLFCDCAGKVVRTTPTGRDTDMELVRSFSVITTSPGPLYPDGAQILQQESSVRNRSTNVVIVTSRLTDELIQETLKVRRQRRMPEMYFVVPAAWSKREVKDASAPLRRLDSMEIPYHLITTDENIKAKSVKADAGALIGTSVGTSAGAQQEAADGKDGGVS